MFVIQHLKNRNKYSFSAIFLLSLTVQACVPVDIYHRAGVTPQKQSSDLVSCEVKAARDVPQNTQVGTTPVFVTPAHTNCYSTGYTTQCTTTGGQVTGGNVYSYDANAGLRSKYITQCMAEKGYTKYSLPQCNAKDLKGKVLDYKTIPAISSNSCVTKPSGRDWIVVNP